MLGIALDETTTRDDIVALWRVFAKDGQALPQLADFERGIAPMIPEGLRRTSPFLTHPVFNRHHSETEMLRYLRGLADKDLALDRSMIPLGSCTMKLNATSEMIPITWPEFANIHPFAPADQRAGYDVLRRQLEAWLCEATGYAGISLQPNAGSQGEYAGLLAIRAWHASRGESSRTICLIPESAHGTNPASAQMAGLQVVVTKCDADGNVDLADLEAKCKLHADRLACVMITYPSTYGVFERRVRELCEIVHRHGGRVYVDGANMNALVGVAAPGEFGGDVSHLNLHKTFCIPHGGGGPGVGPVCVVADLVPFLPGHASGGFSDAGDGGVGAVSAAPLGNAAVLPISWMYMRMMGSEGLRRATETAILSANYIAARLADHYELHYSGNVAGIKGGGVAHECILDLRPLKDATGGDKGEQGISAEDVAKRLIDYGFHAPTLSFPVAGTLMVEPTESESLAELDRFCDAMIAIRAEIAKVEAGTWPRDDNPLKARAAHGGGAARRRLAARLLARGGGVSARVAAPRQVLVAGRPRRQRLGRPQPVVLVPADGQLRGLTAAEAMPFRLERLMRAAAAPPLAPRCHAGHRRIEHRLQSRQACRHALARRRPARFLPLQGPRHRGGDERPGHRPARQGQHGTGEGHGLAPSRGRFPHRADAEGLGALHVRGQGDAGLGRRLRPPAARNRALPVRLLAGHGVSRGRRPGRLHDGRHARAGGGARPDAVARRGEGRLSRARAPQNSMSSSAMSSGSALAAASHSRISGIAMIVSQ